MSQDPTGMAEIVAGYDLHSDNQKILGLPDRTTAKVFTFRAIFADAFGEQGFAGPAFAYANDSDFMATSTSAKFWEEVLERFFRKYSGVYQHSIGLIREAVDTGRIVSPSGRFYLYSPVAKRNGIKDWPRTEIINHIVQGLSADFVMCARRMLAQRLQQMDEYHKGFILPMNTVHDDIQLDILDSDPELCYNSCQIMTDCFRDIPKYFEKHYGHIVNVPMAGEAKFGFTLYEPEMVKFNQETFNEDWTKLHEF